MLQTSRWTLHINNMFMKEDITAQINVGEDGSLTFYAVTPNGLKPFPKEMSDKLTVDGDTISAEVSLEEGKSLKVSIVVTFGEDTAEGYFKIPIFGKLKFKGEKVEMTDLPMLEEPTMSELTAKNDDDDEEINIDIEDAMRYAQEFTSEE